MAAFKQRKQLQVDETFGAALESSERIHIVSGTDHPEVSGGHKGAPAFLSGVYQPVRVGKSIVIKNQITLDQVAANHLGVDTRFKSLQLTSAPDSPTGFPGMKKASRSKQSGSFKGFQTAIRQ